MNRSAPHLILADAVQLTSSRSQRGRYLYPIFFFVLNLFVCAAFERQIRVDATATSLCYFFVLEFGLYGATLLAQYQRLTYPVLEKSTPFSVSPLTTLLFCVWSDLRRPIAIVFLVTNILLLAVAYHVSLGAMLLAVIIFILLSISVETGFVVLALFLRRSRNPETILLVSFVGVLLLTFVVAGFFGGGPPCGPKPPSGDGPVVSFLPVTSWAARGIVAARSSDPGGVLLSVLLLAGTVSICAIVAIFPRKRIW
jgi:hypothetical protein